MPSIPKGLMGSNNIDAVFAPEDLAAVIHINTVLGIQLSTTYRAGINRIVLKTPAAAVTLPSTGYTYHRHILTTSCFSCT